MLSRITYVLAVAAIVLAGGFGMDALMSEPGSVTLDYDGRTYSLTVFWASVALVLIVFAAMIAVIVLRFAFALIRFLLGDESAFSRIFQRYRDRRGLKALAKAQTAVAAGDAKMATKKAKLAERLLGRPELTRITNARAAEMSGDKRRARKYYQAMMEDPESALVGTHGLIGHAIAEDNAERAMQLAKHAQEINPKDPATLSTLVTLQSQAFDWTGARATVVQQKKLGLIDKTNAEKQEAALVLAQAEDAEREGRDEDALSLSVEAARLDLANTGAVATAVRHLIADDSMRAANKLIVDAWKLAPSSDLAAAFAAMNPNESPAERRRRFSTLLDFHADNDEALFLRAELELADEDWAGARSAIERLGESELSARTCAIFAAIARGEGQSESIVRGWLARGLSAPRTGSTASAIGRAAMLPLLIDAQEATNGLGSPVEADEDVADTADEKQDAPASA